MTVQWSTTVRNARLDAIETAIGPAPILRIFSGPKPSTCAGALTGFNLLLAEFTLGSDWAGDASTGSKNFAGLPIVTTGTVDAGAGTNASFYRIYASDDVTCHEQGTILVIGEVDEDGNPPDLAMDNIKIFPGQTVEITNFTKSEPGA